MQRALGQLLEVNGHSEADLTQLQKDLASLRTRDGGLAYGGLPERSGTAYLASWALCLKQVAGELGVLSLAAFQAKCPDISAKMQMAESATLLLGANKGRALDWHQALRIPLSKKQGVWSKEIAKKKRDTLLSSLNEEDAADLRTNGGPGAGAFLMPPVSGDEAVKVIPDSHLCVLLRDRLLMRVCPAGACCKHRRPDGRLCGAPLDARGKHARMCKIQGLVEERHD